MIFYQQTVQTNRNDMVMISLFSKLCDLICDLIKRLDSFHEKAQLQTVQVLPMKNHKEKEENFRKEAWNTQNIQVCLVFFFWGGKKENDNFIEN